jgi:hypothetical protein
MPTHVLIVEPDAERLVVLQQALRNVAAVDGCADFGAGRMRLLRDRPDLLVTNLRLDAYNGLHLVYLAPRPTRSIVYMDREDRFLLREAQQAGAFIESPQRLPLALASYLDAVLPTRDRRDPTVFDRRHSFRPGRRAADVIFLG